MHTLLTSVFLLGAASMSLGLGIVVGMIQEGGPIPATEQRIVGKLIGYGLLAAVPSLVALIVLAARSQ